MQRSKLQRHHTARVGLSRDKYQKRTAAESAAKPAAVRKTLWTVGARNGKHFPVGRLL